MFAEGLVNMQLPFIIISSGISSGLYLLFLFFNIGQPSEQPPINVEQNDFSIEVTDDNIHSFENNNLIHYYNTSILVADNSNINDPAQFEPNEPPKFRSFKFAYSFQFAKSSFNRPPPFC